MGKKEKNVNTQNYVVFWTVHFSIMKTKINHQNAQINSGLIYY